ncbi:uncharacterized protein [Hyperolius riggenbachi]|uniref:uncharacterized protein n=1 Tax=Hyperolius riggenbachi TaxID=752182 RepID=UPI0035A2FFD9
MEQLGQDRKRHCGLTPARQDTVDHLAQEARQARFQGSVGQVAQELQPTVVTEGDRYRSVKTEFPLYNVDVPCNDPDTRQHTGREPSGSAGSTRPHASRSITSDMPESGEEVADKRETGSVSLANPNPSAISEPARALPISDTAKGSLYACFVEPLGFHLSMEMKEKVWRREYIDIFSLLPSARFQEQQRDFSNWLQAFAIMASVIGEKTPDQCCALFCYLNTVLEAHQAFQGSAWLYYDEHFRQCMSIRPSLRWDQKDICLWLRLLVAPTAAELEHGSPFHAEARYAPPAWQKRGVCWSFNEGACKWGATCKFKHQCSRCGSRKHPETRCFRGATQ